MTILEQLREKKEETMSRDLNTLYTMEDYYRDLEDIISQYDLALENALLKLKNRAVEIKDLKHRLNEIERMYPQINRG